MLNGGLLGVNLAQMAAAGPRRPRIVNLIRSGKLRYVRSDPREHWQNYNELMGQLRRRGVAGGDCEDLASAAAAEMRTDVGSPWYDPTAEIFVYRAGPGLSHVIVKSQRFGLLDPSVGGGMSGPRMRGADLGSGLPYPRPPGYHKGKSFQDVRAQPARPARAPTFRPVGNRARRFRPVGGRWGRR